MILLSQANALRIPLADKSVHCVVTSPPYWGLRDYGIDGQLGLEPTPEEYVDHLVQVFREVRRVLRDDGTLWLNLGDSYATGTKAGRQASTGTLAHHTAQDVRRIGTPEGLKTKDLVGIPWRVAFALQADGWWLRSDIIWHKPNCMPESVTDRPTKAHEYLFLLSKSQRYYYDAEAVKEKCQSGPSDIRKMTEQKNRISAKHLDLTGPLLNASALTNIGRKRGVGSPSGRNRRTVWTIPTQPYRGAHFATFPPALVEPCVKAGTSERGACAVCGAPWARVVEKTSVLEPGRRVRGLGPKTEGIQDLKSTKLHEIQTVTTTGWQPSCNHDAEPAPAIVLDPFGGSGTTGQVARALGRRAVLLDLSGAYLHEQARERLGLAALDDWENGKDGGELETAGLPLFEAVAELP